MMETKQTPQSGRYQRRMGFALLGTAYMLAWDGQARATDMSTLLLILLAGLTLFLWAWSDARALRPVVPATRSAQRTWLPSRRSTLMEGGLCGAGLCFNLVLALALVGHLPWLGAALILATGMLCLPLGTILGDRVYYGSGAALILLALSTIGMRILDLSTGLECFGAGCVCWISALLGFWYSRPVQMGKTAQTVPPARNLALSVR